MSFAGRKYQSVQLFLTLFIRTGPGMISAGLLPHRADDVEQLR